MATQTTNLQLVKPEMTDRALIDDINGNMDIIDSAFGDANEALETVVPSRQSGVITDTELEDFESGCLMGKVSAAIHGTDDTYGVIRAYAIKSNEWLQIVEFVDGSRKSRNYTGGDWTNWI
jgi:hypothetical protein